MRTLTIGYDALPHCKTAMTTVCLSDLNDLSLDMDTGSKTTKAEQRALETFEKFNRLYLS
eukprot:g30016.t1